MTGGIRSPLAPWVGGISAPGRKPGYRSILAFWMGGVSSGRATSVDTTTGGGFVYQTPKQMRSHAPRLEELEKVDHELALAEAERQATQQRLAELKEAKRQRKAAQELAALEAKLQDEINALRMERVRLMRLIDDEEAILSLLMSMPFIH